MAEGGFSILSCRTRGVHAVAARSRRSFDRHTHEEFGIGVITAGAQRWRSGRAQVEAGSGTVIAVNPGEVHDGEPLGVHGRAWSMLYFDSNVLAEAARDAFAPSAGEFEFPRAAMPDRALARTVLALFRAETAGAEATRREELLLGIAARAGRLFEGRRFEPPAEVARAKSRIDDDPAAPASLAELAAIAGASRFQLVRGFARSTGFTPHAYIVQKRAQLARHLIRTGMHLADAASAAGFSDQSHMTRVFVRKYGHSPGAFAAAVSAARRMG